MFNPSLAKKPNDRMFNPSLGLAKNPNYRMFNPLLELAKKTTIVCSTHHLLKKQLLYVQPITWTC